ncbi:hypothetical protein STRDD13_00457 [Streptococcus sp. DD13]|nr:hypothetical protein STRDD13_00457 [Streptococcus sp. DD13]
MSLFASLILVFFIGLFFTFDGHGPVTIHLEYSLKEKTIVFERGFLLDGFDEYHELVNPFVMTKEIKKKFILIDELHYRKENDVSFPINHSYQYLFD